MGDVHGTWADVFSKVSPEIAEIGLALRATIISAHPATIEVTRPGDRAVSFGFGVKKMSEAYVYLMPQRDRVNFGFYYGSRLPDPHGLLEGTGKALRHVKIRGLIDATRPQLIDLLTAAIAERRGTLDLT